MKERLNKDIDKSGQNKGKKLESTAHVGRWYGGVSFSKSFSYLKAPSVYILEGVSGEHI